MMPLRNSIFLLLLLAGFGPQTQTPKGSISGRIIDADTKMPLQGVRVGSQKLGWVPTDAGGRYALRDVAPGDAIVAVLESNGGYLNMTLTPPKTVTVKDGRETSGVDFKVRLDGTISGRVFNENGEPLAGIRVAVVERAISTADNTLAVAKFNGRQRPRDPR